MDVEMAPPAVHSGGVYLTSSGFTTLAPQVRAFDAASGKERWQYDIGGLTTGAPAVADDGSIR